MTKAFSAIVLNAASTAWGYDAGLMIDYLSLALGHGLLAIALLRLVMRDDVDVDPRLDEIAAKVESDRAAATNAGRGANRAAGRAKDAAMDQGAGSTGGAA